MTKPIVMSVIGLQNSGKTRLVLALVQFLQEKGLTVAVLKHDGHADERMSNDWQKSGSDTELCRQAGARMTMVVGGGQSLIHIADDDEASQAEQLCQRITMLAEIQGKPLDVILVEGYKRSKLPKVAVIRTQEHLQWIKEHQFTNLKGVYAASDLRELADEPWRVYYDEDIEYLVKDFL
ncbi:molybdopterin-guanine dinucleotide biosynthesis protein B [Alicyclobacillus fastidiosus]|uniref:Molybdopterin-guanine dinucleotide biosynthesis protein B n=1 Tax=Alicyclobacillus fastidiosus TaxID=392011 RepID=A0ABY6ZCW5_9BACL|nr:molybdopterin-guanine dinucleotide biosynthesis protein B [Alicyclobacillus fastidiosus]WAH40689.1 molybdopterin-guanine dinucleotide biosynthesis protein B [Alicyclobacillus fastidiosus]GMA62159.1 molybdopterin-guanine dinucleotide biosynthesis protein MobB [Alicyclobacillus fastidiosus]